MSMKALLALLVIGLSFVFFVGCDDDNDNGNLATVSGTVTDIFGDPVSGATVTLLQNGIVIGVPATTGSSGTYSITDVEQGDDFVIRVESAGFVTSFTKAFAINSDNEFEDVALITASELQAQYGVATPAAGTATLVVFTRDSNSGDLIGGEVQVDALTPINSGTGPVIVTGIAPQTADVFVTPTDESQFIVPDITFEAGDIIVIGNPEEETPPTGTATVSGVIGTVNPNEVFTVRLLQNNNLVATTTAGPAVEPIFTFNNIAEGSGYTIEIIDETGTITTVFGPFTVPATGIDNIRINLKTVDQLASDGVTGTIPPTDGQALVVVYDATTFQLNTQPLSAQSNPSFVRVAPGTYTITITKDSMQVTFPITVDANEVTVIRPNFTS